MLGGQTIGEQIIREQQIWGQANELANCGSFSLLQLAKGHYLMIDC